jgi:hypothetical protein
MSIEGILMYVNVGANMDKPEEFEVQHPSQIELRCRFNSAFCLYEVLVWIFGFFGLVLRHF